MLLIKWQQLSEQEKKEIMDKGLKLSSNDTRFKTSTKEVATLNVDKNTTNRRNDKNYKRTEIYLDKKTKKKLELISKYRQLSYSEVVEGLIRGDYDLIFS